MSGVCIFCSVVIMSSYIHVPIVILYVLYCEGPRVVSAWNLVPNTTASFISSYCSSGTQ